MVKWLLILGALVATSAVAQTPSAAFAKLKGLEGSWTRDGGDGSVASTWKVTASGSAVVETLFPGTPHEMLTVFTLHPDGVHLTHYCSAGNQPEMKAEAATSDQKVVFQFTGGVGIDPKKDTHMNTATFTFTDANTLHEQWGSVADGKQAEPKVLAFKRVPVGTAKPADKKPKK